MDVAEELKEVSTGELTSEKMLRVDYVMPWLCDAVKPDERRRRGRGGREKVDQVLITET